MAQQFERAASGVKRVVVDPAKCVGCGSCVTTCAVVHTGRFSKSAALLSVDRDDANCRFVPKLCVQCHDSPCLDACSTGAISRGETGVLVIDESLCVGCGLCAEACAYGGIRVSKVRNGNMLARKCDQCVGETWCAKVCVTGAIRFD